MSEATPDFNHAVRIQSAFRPMRAIRSGSRSHIVEDHGRAGVVQLLAIAFPAMAAAVETEHGHPCRDGARDAGDAVLDHEALFGR